jgi:hypothetical protein
MSKYTKLRDETTGAVKDAGKKVEDAGKKAGDIAEDAGKNTRDAIKNTRDSHNENNNADNDEQSLAAMICDDAKEAFNSGVDHTKFAAKSTGDCLANVAKQVEGGFSAAGDAVHNAFDNIANYLEPEDQELPGQNADHPDL